jgi:hypothetical protein
VQRITLARPGTAAAAFHEISQDISDDRVV